MAVVNLLPGALKRMPMLVAAVLMASAHAAAPFRIAPDVMPSICIRGELKPFVTRAAEDLAGDVERIFGTRPVLVTNDEASANAIVLVKAGSGFERYARDLKYPYTRLSAEIETTLKKRR